MQHFQQQLCQARLLSASLPELFDLIRGDLTIIFRSSCLVVHVYIN